MEIENTAQGGLRPSDAAPCWVCGSLRSRPYKARTIDRALVSDDLRISDSNYGATLALDRCEDCGFLFANDAGLGELFALYEGLEDPGYEESQEPRRLQMEWLLDAALAAAPHVRSLLDVGAAAGLLVKLARDRGLEAEGVEPSESLVATAKRLHGVELRKGSIPNAALAGRRFDAVFLVDVIEHVADPVGLLRSAAELVAPGGILLVVTPDVASHAQKLLGDRWWHFRLAHVGYFDASSLALACERAGLSVARRFRAKWFFRVGYLAERVGRYLPTDALTRRLGRTALGARLLRQVIPLDLHDSWVFVCRIDR